jgi:hypothetical protein
MNRWLSHYRVDVKHPDVSGAEHFEMLQIRDKLASVQDTLTPEEQAILAAADQALVQQATAFHRALQSFLDLAQYRQEHAVPAERWWWYLDVVCHMPNVSSKISA